MILPRTRRRRLWAAALLLFVISLGLSVYLIGSPPPRRIVLATGDPAGGFAALGRAYKTRLDRMGLRVELTESHGSIDNLRRLLRGEADVAFVQAGVVQEVEGAGGLRALAAVDSEPLWVFTRSDRRLTALRELKGRTVALGPPDSGSGALGRLLLREHGVTPANATFLHLSMDQARRALVDRTAHAALLVCSCDAPVVRDLVREDGVRLGSLESQRAIALRLPYLRPVVLPRGALDLERDLPAEDTALVTPVTMIVAREDLHPRAVEQVLMAAQAVHAPGDLLDTPGQFPSLQGVDLPPHFAAEKFMKSGESLTARVLPYWGVRLVWQVELLLVPLLLLLLPFWRTLPLLYTFRINRILKRHYAALREAERRIDGCGDPTELRQLLEKLDGLRTDLEALSRKLPAHLQRDVYHWRLHVALVRAEGRERLRRLEGQPREADA